MKLICSNPNCIHGGREQDLVNFVKRKSKRGYSSWCRDCLNQDHRKRHSLNKIKNSKTNYSDLKEKKCSNPSCPNGPNFQPPEAFYRDRNSASGLSSKCKVCESVYRKKTIQSRKIKTNKM